MSAVRSVRATADATIDMKWMEYPNGIPVEAWGRDHNSTLLYAEVRAVDHAGALPEDDPHMRMSIVSAHRHADLVEFAAAHTIDVIRYERSMVPQ